MLSWQPGSSLLRDYLAYRMWTFSSGAKQGPGRVLGSPLPTGMASCSPETLDTPLKDLDKHPPWVWHTSFLELRQHLEFLHIGRRRVVTSDSRLRSVASSAIALASPGSASQCRYALTARSDACQHSTLREGQPLAPQKACGQGPRGQCIPPCNVCLHHRRTHGAVARTGSDRTARCLQSEPAQRSFLHVLQACLRGLASKGSAILAPSSSVARGSRAPRSTASAACTCVGVTRTTPPSTYWKGTAMSRAT